MKLSRLELSADERAKLQEVVAKGSNWRARQRAQTLLYFNDGLSAKDIMALQDLNIDTVYDRRKNWLSQGFAFLYDLHRSGAPPKLNAIHYDQIKTWAEKEALTGPAIVARLKEEHDVDVSINTVLGALKKLDFVWKRTRHSLKKNEMKTISEKQSQKSKR
jgi:transposase